MLPCEMYDGSGGLRLLGKHFKNSIALSWIISYAVIFLIPITVSAIIYAQTGRIVEQEIKQANKALLNQVKFIIDSGLLQTEQLASQISIQADIRRFLQMNRETERASSFDIYKTKQEINDYRINNDFIKDIYVYSRNLNTVLTPSTYVEGNLFYNMSYDGTSFSYQDWKQLVDHNNVKSYRVLPTQDNGFMSETAALVQSLPIDYTKQSSGTLIIMLNNNKIKKLLENVDWIKNGQVLILNKNDQKVYDTGKASPDIPIDFKELEQKNDEPYFESVQGKKVMVSHVTSDVVDWKYVSFIPSEFFWERVEHIKQINLMGLFICFLVGSVMIIIFAKKNYNPVKELVRFVTGKAVASEENEQDEYGLIKGQFIKIFQERDDFNNKHNQHIVVLRKYFLFRLLKGQIERELSSNEIYNLYHIMWPTDCFLVMLFHIESGSQASNEIQLQQFIVSNIVTELTGQKHSVHFTDVDGTLASVFNIQQLGSHDWKNELEEGLEKARDFIEEKYKFQFSVAISEPQYGLSGIPKAFIQALEALEYLLLLGSEKIVWYHDIKPVTNNYYYTIDKEQILMNLLKSGDFNKAREVVADVIQSSFSQENTSMEMLKCVMIDLVSTMMKLTQNQESDSSVWEELRPVRRLLKCNTKLEVEQELLDIFNQICQYIEVKNSTISYPGIDGKVADYVRENYQDPNLSVSLIGSYLSISPQYLSKLFKEQSGQGLNDYINQIRITQAKRHLQEGDNIEDSALKTGFASSSAFIRVFKKREGITPGKYKLINGQQVK
jgi:YesN/AraC family two-component response regulator